MSCQRHDNVAKTLGVDSFLLTTTSRGLIHDADLEYDLMTFATSVPLKVHFSLNRLRITGAEGWRKSFREELKCATDSFTEAAPSRERRRHQVAFASVAVAGASAAAAAGFVFVLRFFSISSLIMYI